MVFKRVLLRESKCSLITVSENKNTVSFLILQCNFILLYSETQLYIYVKMHVFLKVCWKQQIYCKTSKEIFRICFSFVLGKFLLTNLCPNCTFSSLKQRMLSSIYRNSQVNKCHLSHQPCCQLQFHFQWKGKSFFLNLKPSFFAYHFLEIRTDSLRSWIMT